MVGTPLVVTPVALEVVVGKRVGKAVVDELVRDEVVVVGVPVQAAATKRATSKPIVKNLRVILTLYLLVK